MFKQKSITGIIAATVMSFSALSAGAAEKVMPNGCKGHSLCDSGALIEGCGWHVDAGLILEQMRVTDTTQFYAHGGNSSNPTWDDPERYNILYPLNFDLEAGLRIGLGFGSMIDDWNIVASFEWLSASTSNEQESLQVAFLPAQNTEYYYPYAGDGFAAPHFTYARSSLAVDYYLLDVAISKGSYFSERFSYEPMAGIKAAWFKFDTVMEFAKDVNTGATALPVGSSYLTRAICNFVGAGPMFGMNANYHLYVGWSIFSYSNLSVLLGESRIKSGYGVVTSAKYPGGTTSTVKLASLAPTVRSVLGLQYDMDIFEERQHMKLRVGFDARYYFNQYPVITTVANRSHASDTTPSDLLDAAPHVVENNAWAMTGLLIDLAWDY